MTFFFCFMVTFLCLCVLFCVVRKSRSCFRCIRSTTTPCMWYELRVEPCAYSVEKLTKLAAVQCSSVVMLCRSQCKQEILLANLLEKNRSKFKVLRITIKQSFYFKNSNIIIFLLMWRTAAQAVSSAGR